MSRVTISMKAARAIDEFMTGRVVPHHAYDAQLELRRAMEPKRKPRKPPPSKFDAGAARAAYLKAIRGNRNYRPSKAQKRAETADLWKQAMARSGGFCECGCGRFFHEEGDNKPEMDHEASRRVPQTITNVWMLARVCHHQRQANKPSEVHWLRIFLQHCNRHGYAKEADRVVARIAVVEVKTALPASPTRSTLGAGLKRSVAPKSGPV